jgi:hypothetical protein
VDPSTPPHLLPGAPAPWPLRAAPVPDDRALLLLLPLLPPCEAPPAASAAAAAALTSCHSMLWRRWRLERTAAIKSPRWELR